MKLASRFLQEPQKRFLATDVELKQDTLTFSFSSEQPVERFYWDIGECQEVLVHTSQAADFGRLNSGAGCLLWNHDPNVVLGIIERAWLQDKRGYCEIRWSADPSVEKYRNQVQEKVLRNVSFLYRILDYEQLKPEQISVTRWEVLEVSLVSVPADPTVGVGRSLQIQEGTMTTQIQDLREEATAIAALGKKYNCESDALRFIGESKSLEDFRNFILERMESKANQNTPIGGGDLRLGLTEREQNQYSLCKAILANCDGDWSKAGFERECHEELERKVGRASRGFFVPTGDLRVQKRDPYLTSGVSSLVPMLQYDAYFADSLRARCLALKLGATMLPGVRGDISIPRRVTSGTAHWVAENDPIPESSGTFDHVELSPKTLGAFAKLSRRTLQQTLPDLEFLVRNDFAQLLAIEMDRAIIAGSGIGEEPLGILNHPDLTVSPLGTNGRALTWADVVELEALLAENNADQGSLAYLTNPKVRKAMKKTVKFSSAGSDILWQEMDGDMAQPTPGLGMVNGYIAGSTTQVPSNLTKGTGNGLSALIFGNWAEIMIATWSLLEIVTNPYGSGFQRGQIEVRAMSDIDIQIRRPESFTAIKDIVTT